jgi:glyoxylase-like metal-dependent hydrolase (beta-lactamase superfamily II)
MVVWPLVVSLLLAPQEQDMSAVQIETVKVAPGIAMLAGRGGNIGVCYGEDGVVLIDDEYAPLTDKIKAAVGALSDKPIRFLLNTHWHFDHTGGNENLGKGGVVIVAHDNVRKRMSVEQFIEAMNLKVPASPRLALPIVTFNDTVTFHMNGDDMLAFHVPPAHTDGDTVVRFQKANVVHMGDVLFNGSYPFVDLSSGGSVDGMIAAVNQVLGMIDAETKIIPGHGPMADRTALRSYRDMLVTARSRIEPLLAGGKTLEEVKAAQLTKDLDEVWGKGFVKGDRFVESVYKSLAQARAKK